MKKDYTKSGFLSFAITIWALICAVFVGFFPDFSWLMLIAILIPIFAAILFNNFYNRSGLTLCRVLVGALFIFSSFTKGVDPLGTKYKMLDYFIAYNIEWLNGLALALSIILIMAEFVVGICLMLNLLPRTHPLGASLLMTFFTITTFFDALYNLVPDCGCFGTAIKMSNWQTFFKNLIILAVLIPLIFNNKTLINKRVTVLGQTLFTFIFIGAFVGFEVYNVRHLPVIDFMEWKVGRDIKPAEDAEPADIYLTFKNIFFFFPVSGKKIPAGKFQRGFVIHKAFLLFFLHFLHLICPQILFTGNILFVQALSVQFVVQIGETVKDNGIYNRCMILVLRNTLVVKVSLGMPYLTIVEVVSFRVAKAETKCRDAVHYKVCVV